MLESLLKVLNLLTELVEYRDKRKARIFSDLIEPMFNDLLLIHGDYIRMFEKVFEFLPGGSVQEMSKDPEVWSRRFSEAAKFVKEKRVEFEPIRIRVRTLGAHVAAAKLNTAEMEFVEAVINYFPGAEVGIPPSYSSRLLSALDRYSASLSEMSVGEFGNSIFDLQISVSHLLEIHRERWSKVCELYAPLKVAHVTRR